MAAARHREHLPRLALALRLEWWALGGLQWALIIAAGGQIAAAGTGLRIPPWLVILDATLIAVYALRVLTRGRPPLPENPAPPEGRHHRHR